MDKITIRTMISNICICMTMLLAVVGFTIEAEINVEAASRSPLLKKVFVYEGAQKIRLVVLFDGTLKSGKPNMRIKDRGVSMFVPRVIAGKPYRQFNVGQGGYDRLEAREDAGGLFISILTKSGASRLKNKPEVIIGKSTLTLTLPVLKGWRNGAQGAPRIERVSMTRAAGTGNRRVAGGIYRIPSVYSKKKKAAAGLTADAMLNQILSSPRKPVASASPPQFDRLLKIKGKGLWNKRRVDGDGKDAVAAGGIKNLKPLFKSTKGTGSKFSNLPVPKGRKNSDLGANVANFSTVAMKFTAALGGILTVILGLFFFFKKVAPDAVAKFGGNGSLVRTLHKTTLAPKKSLAVVEVAGEVLVLGISGQNIAMLTKIENEEALARVRSVGESSFVEHLSKMLGKEVDKIKSPGGEERGSGLAATMAASAPATGGLKEGIQDKNMAALTAYTRHAKNGAGPGEGSISGNQAKLRSGSNPIRSRSVKKETPASKRSADRLRNRLERLPDLSDGATLS